MWSQSKRARRSSSVKVGVDTPSGREGADGGAPPVKSTSVSGEAGGAGLTARRGKECADEDVGPTGTGAEKRTWREDEQGGAEGADDDTNAREDIDDARSRSDVATASRDETSEGDEGKRDAEREES